MKNGEAAGARVPGARPRDRILDLLERQPGVHLREIARSLGLPLGSTLYHLAFLERRGNVSVRRDGVYKRYFPLREIGRAEKDYFAALHRPVPRDVALCLLATGGATQRQLAEAAGVSRSTLSHHLAALVRSGMVVVSSRRADGKEYRLADPMKVRRAASWLLDRADGAPCVKERGAFEPQALPPLNANAA